MKVNRELMSVYRRGRWIDKFDQKQTNNEGVIVGICMALSLLVVIVGALWR